MNVKFLRGSEYFKQGELVEIGRRLSESQLKTMELLEPVIEAEREYLWRLEASHDLLREGSGKLAWELEQELTIARKFVEQPERKSAPFHGNQGYFRDKRTLPSPGTLIIKQHNYQYYNRPERLKADGSIVSSETFRFVVVTTPSQLIRLGESNGPIYISVSGAAGSAIGGSTNGWKFFGIY